MSMLLAHANHLVGMLTMKPDGTALGALAERVEV